MNIFLLDQDPVVAAQMQCDKHVVKMIVESAQMLSTAHRLLDGKKALGKSKSGRQAKVWVHPTFDDVLYKVVHINHPCTIWTREGYDNYMWHFEHFDALCKEYTFRYGKIHATEKLLGQILSSAPVHISPIPTVFRMAVGEFPWQGNQVETYRKFYFTKRERFDMVWTKRETPEWYRELEAKEDRSNSVVAA